MHAWMKKLHVGKSLVQLDRRLAHIYEPRVRRVSPLDYESLNYVTRERTALWLGFEHLGRNRMADSFGESQDVSAGRLHF